MGDLITVEPIKTDQVEIAIRESGEALVRVQNFEIVNQDAYKTVCETRRTAKGEIKKLNTERKDITKDMDSAKKKIMDLFRKPIDVWEKIVDICNKGTTGWDAKQEESRKAQQEKLNRQAEVERQKKEEQSRVWKEKEEAKRQEAKRLAAEGKEEEEIKALQEAEKAAKKAEERQGAANEVIAPVVAPSVGKVKGTYSREEWYGEVVDFKLLPDEYKLPNQPMINKVAKASKGTLPIPGVVIKSRPIIVDRG